MLRVPSVVCELEIVSGCENGRKGGPHGQSLSGGSTSVCVLSHAQGRVSRLAFQVHRSPNQNCENGRVFSELNHKNTLIILFVAALTVIPWSVAPLKSNAQGSGMSDGSGHVAATAWRPNKKDAIYVGPQACVKCH